MPEAKNIAITLAARPEGEPKDSDFRIEERTAPEPGEGEVLLKTLYLSLDPYMRGRMSGAKSYSSPVEIGDVMVGQTVSKVVASNHHDLAVGDHVLGNAGWQQYAVSNGSDLRKLDPGHGPVSYALGVLGMPGHTAYVGLLDIGRPQAGETVVVSAASGAVGQVVGQIAKLKGCYVVGVAGSEDKCAYVVDELGFDACVNYKRDAFEDELAQACPDGVDVYFESVGGRVLDAVLPLLNIGARIPLCGTIAHYNATSLPEGPNRVPQLMRTLLVKRVTIRGFIIFDHYDRYPDFLRDMSQWLAEGKVRYREHVVDGLENAPAAFRALMRGDHVGKMLVRVGE